MSTDGSGSVSIRQNAGPSGVPEKQSRLRTVLNNSLTLSTSGCSRNIRETSVEPHRPVLMTNVGAMALS